MITSPSVLFGQTCTSNSTRLTGQPLGGDAGCSISCTNGLMYNLGPYQTPTPCLSPLGDGMRLHAGISPIGFEPMPTIRFSYHVEGIVGDCAYERAGRIGIMPPFIIDGFPAARLYPVSLNGNFGQNFDVGDVFLVSTCDAKDLLLSTNNAGSRIKFFTTKVAGTQNERMTILDNGQVGIGTATPLEALHINQKLTFHVGENEYYIGYNQYENTAYQTKRISESPTMGIMFAKYENTMFITNNGTGQIGTNVNYKGPNYQVKGISIWNDNNDVMTNGDKGYIGLGTVPDPNSRVVVRGLTESDATKNAFRVTNDEGTPQTRFAVKDNGNVGIGTDIVKSQFQINDMLGFFAGNSSVIAHNAYYNDGWKRMSGSTGQGKKPAAIGMSDGGITLQVGAEGMTGSPITWNTAFSIANDGKVTINNLAGTGERAIYANANGELVMASGSAGGWSLSGNTVGTNSVFIGTIDEKPLVFKTYSTPRMQIAANGDVHVGNVWDYTSTAGNLNRSNYPSLLSVNGAVVAKLVRVTANNWADNVFRSDYQLMSLSEVKEFIDKNGHLPEVPTEQEVQKNGVDLQEIQATLLRKVEELTLHLIKLEQENKQLRQRMDVLDASQPKPKD
ncbi:MAG: hypothetical protein JST20_09420 [Bacteroidetes bacterium]|nr:hypothetical protein [Bacteroidota bacterium]